MTSIKRMGLTTLSAAILATAIGACDSLPRHLPVSLDRHVYESTVSLPTTVEVVEPYSGEVLWTMAIPVQHKLTLDFNRKGEFEPANIAGYPATSMNWRLSGTKKESGKIELPGTPVGMKISYRKAPEFPEGKEPASMQPKIEPVTPDAPLEPAKNSEEIEAPAANGDVVSPTSTTESASEPAPSNGGAPIEATDPADAAQTK